uniref:sensor histidine kinase N-terminal domain-containing protein n=1 Tax=Yoonia sp. TaxID=2212373 RepID=UPI004048ABE1
MNKRGSILRRLMLQLVGAAAVLAAILFVLFQSFARQLAIEAQDNTLFASASAILESVSVQQGEVNVDIPYAALSMLGNVSDDRVFYRIGMGAVPLTGYDDLPGKPGADAVSWTDTYRGDDLRMVQVSRALSVAGALKDVTVVVGQTQGGLAQKLAQISRMAILIGAIYFVVASLFAYWTARSTVRPLNAVAEAVARRGPLDLRPVTKPVPSEMAPLMVALNAFISRLDRSLTRSEDFIVEAAHRVRTPLATVRAQAEVTLRRVDRQENRNALKQMIRAVDESSRAAGQLLDHAMVAFRTDHLDQQALDLGAIAAEVVERQTPVAALKDITFDVDIIAGGGFNGDAILIQNAVTNLIDNAVKYSPQETTITVSVKGNSLQICDQGPGFPIDDIDTLTDRFARGTNVGTTVGSGLGLTIAHEVALAHNGALILSQNPKGTGACVTLSLPS